MSQACVAHICNRRCLCKEETKRKILGRTENAQSEANQTEESRRPQLTHHGVQRYDIYIRVLAEAHPLM